MNAQDFPGCRGARRLPARLALLAACLLVAWLLPRPAAAACWIASSPTISFGTANAGGATSTGTLHFVCDNYDAAPRTYRVCLYMNPNTPTGVAPRRMVNWGVTPNAYLSYDLYADPARTQVLGSESSGHPVYSTVLTVQQGQAGGSMPIHARLAPGQTVAAGSYVSQNTSVLRWADRSGPSAPSAAECANGSTHYTEVRANYENGCFISTATDLDFGTVTALGAPRDRTSAISLHCPAGTAWRVGLDYGANAQGNNRRMAGPGGYIGYQLYRDNGRTQAWGPSSPNDATGTGNNATQTLTVHGRVPPQAVAPGTYSDTVTVTLTY